ncbi:MAG: VWA domain-containing protein [Pseudomonadales bacterium]
MRAVFIILLAIVGVSSPAEGSTPPAGGELKIEIHSSPTDLTATGSEPLTYEIEGVASTIGGVRYIDMMLVMDTSASLRDTDPDGYRTLAAVGLIARLSPKSDIRIGVIGFNDSAELLQPLTDNRNAVSQAIRDLKRRGGTDLAEGIESAVEELNANGREDASRVIVLFTDGMSNEKKAMAAAELARAEGIAVQTLLLGENLKGGFLLEAIAQTSGGSFVWVLDPTELPDAFLNLKTTGVDTVTLSVNGSEPVPAELTAGAFSGSVPLTAGENRIVALATSLDGRTKESVITVNVSDASCAALEVAATHDGLPAISLNERAVEIVVDASRSMWGQIDGVSKMEIAKDILHTASASLPDDLDLALRAYGNASASEDNDCADSGLLVPFGLSSRQPISAAIDGLKPKGQTPIAYALKQAAADFGPLDGERSLVLVTDGIESCGGDPVAAARELADKGITLHVIGFGIGNVREEDAVSLQTMAHVSGGHYLTANSADELKGALDATVGTRFRVYDGVDVVASGVLGASEPMFLPSGDYRIRFDSVPRHEVAFTLSARDKLNLMMERQGSTIVHNEYRDLLEATSCEAAVAATKRKQREVVPTLGIR